MQVSKEVIAVLDELGTKVGIAIDWTNANVLPQVQDIMNRMVKYQIYKTSISILIEVAVILLILFLVKKIKTWAIKNNEWDEEIAFGVYLVSGAIIIILSFFVIDDIFALVKFITVPEMYWFDYLKGLKK